MVWHKLKDGTAINLGLVRMIYIHPPQPNEVRYGIDKDDDNNYYYEAFDTPEEAKVALAVVLKKVGIDN